MKKILYNIYLYLTMFLGIMTTMMLMFYIPANYDIFTENTAASALLIVMIVATLLITAILCFNFNNKLENERRSY